MQQSCELDSSRALVVIHYCEEANDTYRREEENEKEKDSKSKRQNVREEKGKGKKGEKRKNKQKRNETEQQISPPRYLPLTQSFFSVEFVSSPSQKFSQPRSPADLTRNKKKINEGKARRHVREEELYLLRLDPDQ